MLCPICGSDTKVIDARINKAGVRVRRRQCKDVECQERFTTVELGQMQVLEKLDELLPMDLVDKISVALGLVLNENPESPRVPRDLFDFYFFKEGELKVE